MHLYAFVACVILYLIPFARVLLRFGDEGTIVYGGVRVLQGQVPSRDFFEVMGPGVFYWIALFFKVFGTTWVATRIAVIVTASANALLLYLCAQRLSPLRPFVAPILVMAVSFPHWLMPSHHSLSNLLSLLSFYSLLKWLNKPRVSLLFTVGLLLGLTTCVMQAKGLLLLFSCLLVIFLVRRENKRPAFFMICLSAGYLSVLALLCAFYWKLGAVHNLVYANFIWPLTRYEHVNTVPYGLGFQDFYWNSWVNSFTAAFPLMLALLFAACLAVPYLVVLGLPVTLASTVVVLRKRAFRRDNIAFWICGIALWVSELHRKDITHLVYGSPLLLIVWLDLSRNFRHRLRVSLSASLMACSFALALSNLLVVRGAGTETYTRRGTVYEFKKDEALEFIQNNTRPGDEVFVYPYYPMYYFLADVRNPTSFSILMYDINTEAQFKEAIGQLDSRRVQYVLSDTEVTSSRFSKWFPRYKEPCADDLIMERYLTTHYDMVSVKNGFRILKRRNGAIRN